MCPIVNEKSAPQHVQEFKEWRIREWGPESECRNDGNDRTSVPQQLFYVAGGKLLGGLAFTRFKNPCGEGVALWVNSVIVAVEHRKKGIGSELVRSAEREAKRCDEPNLFVYTNTPQLYTTNGWVALSEQNGHVVLKAGSFSEST